MKKSKIILISVLAVLAVVLTAAGFFFIGTGGSYYDSDGRYAHVTARSSFGFVENHPAFAEYSYFIQPWKEPINSITTVRQTMRSVCVFNNYNTESIVGGLNWLIDMEQEGRAHFFDYAQDGSSDTGLIYVAAEDPDAPLAVLVSGGAFTAVCVFGEAFPVAKELYEAGYNIVIMKYRVSLCKDGESVDEHSVYQIPESRKSFNAAMQYIFAHTDEIRFDVNNYSVWGFSAGGHLSNLWGMDDGLGYAGCGVPKPTATILAYSGWFEESCRDICGTQPPMFFGYCENDRVLPRDKGDSIPAYIEFLRSLGIPVEAHGYKKAPHGFGTGKGTDAEGWIEYAVSFWEKMAAEKAA